MIKTITILLMLALFSAASIIAGYLNMSIGIDPMSIGWVYESVPIIKTTLMLVWVFFFDMLLAFYTSKGHYKRFYSEFIGYSIIFPMIIILSMLPGALDVPDHLGNQHYLMLILIFISQLIFGKYLYKEFLCHGGRDEDSGQWPYESYIQSEKSEIYNNENFEILQDLAYIIECFASSSSGEGKSELGRLIDKLEESDISNKENTLDTLKEALKLFNVNQDRHAKITIVRASRYLWREAYPRNAEH